MDELEELANKLEEDPTNISFMLRFAELYGELDDCSLAEQWSYYAWNQVDQADVKIEKHYLEYGLKRIQLHLDELSRHPEALDQDSWDEEKARLEKEKLGKELAIKRLKDRS